MIDETMRVVILRDDEMSNTRVPRISPDLSVDQWAAILAADLVITESGQILKSRYTDGGKR